MSENASAAFRRYYPDDGCTAVKAPIIEELLCQMHALYARWLLANAHPRDYIPALDHVTSLFMVDYLLAGKPRWTDEDRVPASRRNLPGRDEVSVLSARPARSLFRFYNEEGDLEHEVCTEDLREGLAPLFVNWLCEGWHPRDFSLAVREAALIIAYDHDLAKTLAGLGGGKNEIEFLTQPYNKCGSTSKESDPPK